MTRGRKGDLTYTERMLLYSGMLAGLRARKDHFWASQAQKVYDQLNGGSISWGALLPALRRLEDAGFLTAEWISEDPRHRPIRYYSLTEKGKEAAASVQAHSPAPSPSTLEPRRLGSR